MTIAIPIPIVNTRRRGYVLFQHSIKAKHHMKNIQTFLSAIALLALICGAVSLTGCANSKSETSEHASHGTEYFCPMHHEVILAGPGTCPKCGMKLVEKR